MLYLDNQDTIADVVVFGDDREFNKFYLIPKAPTLRVNEEGKPDFYFTKYRNVIDNSDGSKGGGWVIFGAQLSVSDEKLAIIKKELDTRVKAEAQKRKINPAPPVKIADVNYTEGKCTLIMMSDQKLVQKIFDAAKPSLYGNNVVTYGVELTPEGATLFEQCLQGEGGFVGVQYEMKFEAKLPPLFARASWDARAFYSFVQKVDIKENWCGNANDYQETLHEVTTRSESREIFIDPGSSRIDPKVLTELRSMLTQALDEAVERNMIKALPVENPEEARKWYQEKDIEHVRKEVVRFQAASFSTVYREETIFQAPLNPNGPLPNITSLKDKKGNPILWKDYSRVVDLDDPFFQTKNVNVSVNASFDDSLVTAVEVKLQYNGKPMDVLGSKIDGEFRFTSPDQHAHFACFLEDGNQNYKYSYQVNYKGSSKIFQSKVIDADDNTLTIGVDDIGILKVDLLPGDIDFNEVTRVQVIMRYEDKENSVKLIEQQFIITEQTPVHRFQKVIFAERDKPYKYMCKYFMKNGKEFRTDWQEEMSPTCYINDPFNGNKLISLRSAADFENEVQSIFVDLKYNDEANKYLQTTSVALNEGNPFFDWSIPVINENSGVVSYKGNIVYKGGTLEAIPDTVADSSTIMITANRSTKDSIEVTVSPILLDFSEIKLVKVQLRYSDPVKKVLERKDMKFTEMETDDQTWSFKIKNPDLTQYEWSATFYMTDGSKKTIPFEKTDALSIDLEIPENA